MDRVTTRRLGLGWPLVGGVAAVGGLYVLGRLKSLYYYQTFGVDIGSLDLDFWDHVFESWFTAQNLLFLVLLWWIALKTRSIWIACIAAVYALIPMASHYAFVFHDSAAAAFLIGYRHTLLKLIPFAVLIVVWAFFPRHRGVLKDLSLPIPPVGLVLFTVIALAWAISAAKHFGSFDANLVTRDPAAHLVRVRLGSGFGPTRPPAEELYVLHASRESVILWDHTGFNGTDSGSVPSIRTLVVPRSAVEWIEGRKTFRVQPGNRFL
jgi:hypothetical protein